jgi:hypothetical protein
VPITLAILVGLFLFQKRGTGGIGAVFGPLMLVWFGMIGGLGLVHVARAPQVLVSVSPVHAIRFFAENGVLGFLVLGSVFLVVTGGEALYADMGHFGRRPIRIAWFALILPALLLNYWGQGALLLADPSAAEKPGCRRDGSSSSGCRWRSKPPSPEHFPPPLRTYRLAAPRGPATTGRAAWNRLLGPATKRWGMQ